MSRNVSRKLIRSIDESLVKPTRKRQREETPAATPEEIRQSWTRKMLALDATMTGNKHVAKSLAKLRNDRNVKLANEKRSRTAVVTGTRTSAQQPARIPTVDKKKHKREKRQTMIERIAKKLKKSKK